MGPGSSSVFLGFGDGSFFPSKLSLARPLSGPIAVADLTSQDSKPDLLFGAEGSGASACCSTSRRNLRRARGAGARTSSATVISSVTKRRNRSSAQVE